MPKNKKRQVEIDTCFQKNIENPIVKKFFIFFEKESDMALIPDHKKIVKKFYPERVTYGWWLKETNKLPSGSLSVFINSDIYLTDSVRHLILHKQAMIREKIFVALTRYNPDGDGFKLNEHPHWTQDMWAVVKPFEGFPTALVQEASFELGQPGCDNKIAYVMHSYGFAVSNPCGSVKTIHLQADEKREYDAKSNKLLGVHAFVHATHTVLQKSKLEFDFLTRSHETIGVLRVNNWINGTSDYQLVSHHHSPADSDSNRSQSTEFNVITFDQKDRSGFIDARSGQYIKRELFDIHRVDLLHDYSKQYKVYSDGEFYYFFDRYWPHVKRFIKTHVHTKVDANDLKNLFVFGFLPTILEIDGLNIGEKKRYPEDNFFWQLPCKTEGYAYEIHSQLEGFNIIDAVVNVYIGKPWATFIDILNNDSNNSYIANVEVHIGLLANRIKTARTLLKQFGFTLRVHTVCQHVYWRNIIHFFKRLTITDLWISHKNDDDDDDDDLGFTTHAWPLFAVNVQTPSRRKGIVSIPVDAKSYLASFTGAHMDHYLSNVRLNLKKHFANRPGFHVKVTDMWHFNDTVYNQQLGLDVNEFKSTQDNNTVFQYNQLLSNSKFSLCPLGAGVNSLRLWESMAIGSIPVVLSNGFIFPEIDKSLLGEDLDWSDAVIIHDENSLDTLEQRLRAIDSEKILRMQSACKKLFSATLKKICFGRLSSNINDFNLASVQDGIGVVLVPNKHHRESNALISALFETVNDWAQRGWCDIQDVDSPFFSINARHSVLLMPHFANEVIEYKYAFMDPSDTLLNDRTLPLVLSIVPNNVLDEFIASAHLKNFEQRHTEFICLNNIDRQAELAYGSSKKITASTFVHEASFSAALLSQDGYSRLFLSMLEGVRFGICQSSSMSECITFAGLGVVPILFSPEDKKILGLEDGVNCLVLEELHDLPSLSGRISSKAWKDLSDRARNWYKNNHSAKALFDDINARYKALDLSLSKPKTVFIKQMESELYRITYESCIFFNPEILVVTDPLKNSSGLTLEAGDVIINELPFMDSQGEYEYKISFQELENFKKSLLEFRHPKYRELATILKLRLRNFEVQLAKNGLPLIVSNYINDSGQLAIDDTEIQYEIKYDGPHPCREIKGQGILLFPQLVITKATLNYLDFNGLPTVRDLTHPYCAYVDAYGRFIPTDDLGDVLGLESFSNAQNLKIIINYIKEDKHAVFTQEVKSCLTLISLFKDQQIHIKDRTESKFNGVFDLQTAKFPLSEQVTDVIFYFDQLEHVHALLFEVQSSGEGLCAFEVQCFRTIKYGKYEPLNTPFIHRGKDFLRIPVLEEKNRNAFGIKLLLRAIEGNPTAVFSVEVRKNYFAKQVRKFDKLGMLKVLSESNPQRRDDVFDTQHIESGDILLEIPKLVTPEICFEAGELFPCKAARQLNLIGEPIRQGISMYVHLMNRNENVEQNLPNWLTQGMDELILLDWSSKVPVSDIPGVFDDPRVRVVRVEGQEKFIRTLAQNLATQMCRFNKVLKCDSDVLFEGDFFDNHPLQRGEFWVGDWHQGRDFNERHLHGETYYHLDDFFTVNGYDERILAYGHDDTNLKDRMVIAGLIKKVFNYNFLHHIPHEQSLRTSNQDMVHPMVKTYENRLVSCQTPLWSPHEESLTYLLVDNSMLHNTDNRFIRLEATQKKQFVHDPEVEAKAIDIVAGWYVHGSAFSAMSREEKIKAIWELQVE